MTRYLSASLCLLFFSLSMRMGFSQELPDPLRVGIIPYKTETALTNTFEPLFRLLAKENGIRVEIQYLEEKELAYEVNQGNVDLGIFKPIAYLEAKNNFPELSVFGTHSVNDHTSYKGAIIANAGSSWKSLADVTKASSFSPNQDIAFVKNSSTSGFRYPKNLLAEHGIRQEGDINAFTFSGSHENSLSHLLTGKTQLIAVDLEAVDQLSDSAKQEIRILESYEIPYHAYVWAPSLEEEVKLALAKTMFEAHKNPTFRTVFDNPLHIQKWVSQNDAAYNPLRRGLHYNTVKPRVKLLIEPRAQARDILAQKGDLLDVFKDKLEKELQASVRFSGYTSSVTDNAYVVSLSLGAVDDDFFAQAKLGEEFIYSENLSIPDLQEELPTALTESILRAMPLETDLHYDGTSWFIFYGKTNGINKDDYEFSWKDDRGKKHVIPSSSIILPIADTRTDFSGLEGLNTHTPITIAYKEPVEENLFSFIKKTTEEEGFWDNLDNRWGVTGLVIALLSVLTGSYLAHRKRRLFKRMMLEANESLRSYVNQEGNPEANLLELQDRASKSLEKAMIEENQFLILKHRLTDIGMIIHRLDETKEESKDEVLSMLTNILRSDQIREKDVAHILSIVRKLPVSSAE
ncbi:MAG: PhnD/SsuA/transferrin family substrate-binding protein [Bacteroidota bacterium]